MTQSKNRLSRFWHELRRRKILPFLIGYIAACFAIIEFSSNASDRYNIPDKTIDLLYILAAIGLPFVIVLPWVINRKKPDTDTEKAPLKEIPSGEEETAKHNLPSQLTTFIGRVKEMQIVKELISEHRLVTLTGAGGCGKTRLACEMAIQLLPDFKDGVWLVNLAPIQNEDMVAKEITEALNITEVPDHAIIDTLIETIKDQKLLIVLDNCEHLIKACAEISGKLIQNVPKLKILATSRASLNITGEQVWRVPSLSLLDPKTIIDLENVEESEAVMLFKDRARLNNPDFELETQNVTEVVTICNKVDGIPLALELVASRTKHMDPKMILERFADRFDQLSSPDPGISKRQQTLEATIEWSYNLLSDSEKLLFNRLSVFQGGFDLAAAEEVCSDDHLPKEVILDALSRLVDRSLVYTVKADDQTMRYNTLETLKQYAQKVLKDTDEEITIKKRHLHHFLELAEEAYQEQYEEQLKWFNKLHVEDDNFIAALDWSEKHSPEEFSSLSGALTWYWKNISKLVVGNEYLEKAHSIKVNRPEVHARVLYGLGMLSWYFHGVDEGIRNLEESLEIWRNLNKLQEEANCTAALCELHRDNKHDFETGLKYGEKSLEIAQKIGKPGFINRCLSSVCQSLVHSKQFERGLPYVEELIVSSEKLEQPVGIMYARHFHSDCALGIKNFKEAEKRYAYGIEVALKYWSDWMQFVDMQGMAFALSGQKRLKKSLLLNAASMEKARTMGVNIAGAVDFWDEWIETYIEGAKKEVGEELARQYEEEGIAMGFDKAVEYALDFAKD